MLFAQLLVCWAVPTMIMAFSLVDEEDSSFVQVSFQKNWKRGKAPEPAAAEDSEDGDDLDDMSLMQTQVSSQHRTGAVQHMRADVSPDGGAIVMEEAVSIHGDRPSSSSIDDAFSLLQTKIEVSSVVVHRDNAHAKPAESLSKGTGILWLDSTLEKLKLNSWQAREWIAFLVCLLMLEYVVYKATVTKVLKPEDLEKLTRWKKARTPEARPKRLSLSVPLRQLLDKTGDSVKLLRSADGSPAFLATISEDAASGDRTVQVRDAAKPTEALISVGPLARSSSVENCSAVYRHTAGHTIGALKSEGPGSWSVSKNGQQSLQISSSAPSVLAISTSGGGTMNAMRTCHFNEVAWVKPPSAETQPEKIGESLELSICEDFDPALAVACALAVLVTSSSGSSSSEECTTKDETPQ